MEGFNLSEGEWVLDGYGCGRGISAVKIDSKGMYERLSTVLMLHDYGDGEKSWEADNLLPDLYIMVLSKEMAQALYSIKSIFECRCEEITNFGSTNVFEPCEPCARYKDESQAVRTIMEKLGNIKGMRSGRCI